MTDSRYASVRGLAAVVERVAPRDPVAWESRPLVRGRQLSAARARQLRATLGQLDRALSHGGFPRGGKGSVSMLLSTRGVDRVMELGQEGALRDPNLPMTGPFSWSQMATLRDCLGLLAELVGVDDKLVLPRVYRDSKNLKATPSPAQSAVLYRRMADMAANQPMDVWSVRTLAVVGIVLDSGARSGELAAMRADEVGRGAGSVRIRRQPQNATHLPDSEPETIRLREGAKVALRRWLAVRREVVDALEGTAPAALWVSLWHATVPQPGGRDRFYPPGMPLSAQAIRTGHRKGIERINTAMAGQWVVDESLPGGGGPWVPLPTTLEQLRRSVDLREWSI